MYGYIYLTTNLINDRKYIGKHKSTELDEKYLGSGTALESAVRKYGIDNFKTEILYECDTLDELNQKEHEYIDKYDAVNSREFYNLKNGGDGGGSPKQYYITNGVVNKKVFEEEFENYFSLGFRRGGPIQTEEAKLRRANANRGKKHPTAGANISKALMGKKLSDEHKQKLRESKLGKPSCRAKSVLCVDTGMIYRSLKDATLSNGFKSSGNLCSCLKGNRKTAFGYH